MGVVVVECGTIRIGKADLDGGVFRPQALCHAGKRAAGTDRADEAVDLAVRVAPDLGRSRRNVRVTIGDIVELVGPDRAIRFGFGKLSGQAS
ncbi:hypothetical protein D9M72_583320 [compost metagenome]